MSVPSAHITRNVNMSSINHGTPYSMHYTHNKELQNKMDNEKWENQNNNSNNSNNSNNNNQIQTVVNGNDNEQQQNNNNQNGNNTSLGNINTNNNIGTVNSVNGINGMMYPMKLINTKESTMYADFLFSLRCCCTQNRWWDFNIIVF